MAKKPWENVKVCTNCHTLFDSVAGRDQCPACVKKEEEAFMIVYKYIRDNKKAGLFEISEECKVRTKKILEWVRQERLSFTKESEITIECEKCGKPILTGRYCLVCKAKMVRTLQSFYVNKDPYSRDDEIIHGQTRIRFNRE